ncbi:MAG: HPF/RaiA family ribosome-associated protein [Bacteroidota bacterium]
MIIQINTNSKIQGSQNMEAYFTERIEDGLKHFSDYITRVEVHVSDQNGDKGGADDIQCKIEARLQGQQPVLVESREENQDKALSVAIDKMQGVMRKVKGKMQNR